MYNNEQEISGYEFLPVKEYDRAKIPYDTSTFAVFDLKGKVFGYYWKIKDIGKRKLTNQAKDNNGYFFSGIAGYE